MAVRVVTDSSCDLPADLVGQLGIEVVPLTIRFGEEEFVDRVELTPAEFWARMRESPFLPETSAPSAGAFEDLFRRLVDQGADGIICITLSSKLSGTLQSAQVGSKAVEGEVPIEVIDSQTVSMAVGNLAAAAARMAAEGSDVPSIAAHVADLRDRTELFGTLDTLENLKKGGRIGGAQALLGSMLSIKPVVTVDDGEVQPAARVRTRSKALRWLVDRVKEEGTVENLAVLHGDAPDVNTLLEMFEPLYPTDQIVVGEVGPVIGTHAGPRVIGVTYHRPR
jgi:fatty acid kinase fatty acid binding subunit